MTICEPNKNFLCADNVIRHVNRWHLMSKYPCVLLGNTLLPPAASFTATIHVHEAAHLQKLENCIWNDALFSTDIPCTSFQMEIRNFCPSFQAISFSIYSIFLHSDTEKEFKRNLKKSRNGEMKKDKTFRSKRPKNNLCNRPILDQFKVYFRIILCLFWSILDLL